MLVASDFEPRWPMRIVAGEWGGRRIQAPPGRGTRPTTDGVREAWMSTVAPVLPGARVLDLFAGSGALGLEALSRGAASAAFVEQNAGAIAAIRPNAAKLGANVDVLPLSALSLPKKGPFDLIVADPPYAAGAGSAVVESVLHAG